VWGASVGPTVADVWDPHLPLAADMTADQGEPTLPAAPHTSSGTGGCGARTAPLSPGSVALPHSHPTAAVSPTGGEVTVLAFPAVIGR